MCLFTFNRKRKYFFFFYVEKYLDKNIYLSRPFSTKKNVPLREEAVNRLVAQSNVIRSKQTML